MRSASEIDIHAVNERTRKELLEETEIHESPKNEEKIISEVSE